MADLDIDTALGWRDRTVHDHEGEKIGTFGAVYLDRETSLPAWGGVRTGLFGHNESYIPLDDVEETEDGLRVPFTKDQVKDAPNVDPEVALSAAEEERLWSHYGREYAPVRSDEGGEGGDREVGGERGAGGEHGASSGHAAPRDDAMTRSEEEVEVGEGPMRPAERVRLRKVLVTEHQQRTVPVQREVIDLEEEPADERPAAGEDPSATR